MRHRWPIVMVDEFQDTDQVQWQVIDRAFSGHSTVILIGDPKQAIYAFRGGDIVTYLEAAKTAGEQKTLATNWRSDSALLDRLQVVLRGAQLGDAAIVVEDVEAHHRGHRLAGAPHNDPFRLRVVARETLGRRGVQNPPIDRVAGAHRRRPRRRYPRVAGQRCDIRRRATAGPRHRGDRGAASRRRGLLPGAVCRRHPGGLHRQHRRVHLRRRGGLALPAGGIRPTAPPRDGARGRGDGVLRRNRGNPCGRR